MIFGITQFRVLSSAIFFGKCKFSEAEVLPKANEIDAFAFLGNTEKRSIEDGMMRIVTDPFQHLYRGRQGASAVMAAKVFYVLEKENLGLMVLGNP